MAIKVLHLITDLNTGGAEMSLYRLLAGMDRVRFEIQVVSLLSPGPLGEKIRGLGIPVRSLDLQPGRPTPAALLRLTGWLREEKPDLLQTWLYHADLLGILAARLAGIPVVVWNIRNAEMELRHYRRLSGWVVRVCAWLSGWPRAVISNSNAGRDFHTRCGYHPARWVIIPNGIDTQVFKPDAAARAALRSQLGLDSEAILIGQVARYDPMKNQAGFLQAAGELARAGVRAHFVMAGQDVTGENPALVEAIKQQGLTGRVHLLGRQDDPGHIEAALDILASASSGEGFPNVVAEAMACGVPCAVTDVGDSAVLVGRTGLVVPPGDPAALAAAWKTLLARGTEGRRELGAAARKRIADLFSLDKTISAYQDLYLELTGGLSEGQKGKAV